MKSKRGCTASDGSDLVETYFDDLKLRYKTGNNATEHTHRPALQGLLESVLKGILATNEPQRIDCGAPDFVLTHGNIPIGYVEAKDLDKNLDEQEKTEQLGRYFRGLDNLILTNYLEFRWYVKGKLRQSFSIGVLKNKKLELIENSGDGLISLLQAFRSSEIPTIKSAQELAERLAGSTTNIYYLIQRSFEIEKADGYLHQWLKAFRSVLISDLDVNRFADMFAQTLVYGYFTARVNHPEEDGFNRDSASKILPETNPFLRRLFHEFVGLDMPKTVDWAVVEVVEILKRTDIRNVMNEFDKKNGKNDAIFHFYETFLEKYNPDLKDAMGAFYTPKPVINYIVNSVDHVIQEHFDRPKGLADENTLVLDPATGTGSFLHETIDVIRAKLKGQEGTWPQYVSDHLLNRIFGFEIMMAPYSVAHLKIGNQLKASGYKFNSGKRLGIYLTNTLEEAAQKSESLFSKFISDEANEAASIKSEKPIVAVIGNPPYKGFAQNKGDWIQSLMADYKVGLGEKKSNSDNDYMKFFRFAQWRIDKTGHGVCAFITPNVYLDAITLRQMRSSLLDSFSDIYVLNLHGSAMAENAQAKEHKDKPVFDIKQGVAISIFVKKKDSKGVCNVHYSEIFGSRESKYSFLERNHLGTTKWKKLALTKERNFFSPTSLKEVAGYRDFISVKDIFPLHNSGIQPKKKEIAIQFSDDEMADVISDFGLLSKDEIKSKYGIDKESKGWQIQWAQDHAKEILKQGSLPTRIQYRTFDYRWTVIEDYSSGIVGRPRYDTMKHMKRPKNIGMVLLRQLSQSSFQHAWVSRDPIDENTISRKTKEYNYIFPLFLEPDQDQLISDGQRVNIGDKIKTILSKEMGLSLTSGIFGDFKTTIGPEQLFYYVYGILHSPSYRTKYFSELKIEFPRIPIVRDLNLFKKISEFGEELSKLHLLEHGTQNAPVATFPEQGSNHVERLRFEQASERLWINEKQYFGTVTQEQWKHKIGGHEVVKEFFTDRIGRKLTSTDVETVRKMLTAVKSTPALMASIDTLIDKHGGWDVLGQKVISVTSEGTLKVRQKKTG
jgi:hypothetical protein